MKKGFTLVELVAVMAVVSVLLSVVLVGLDTFGNKAKTRDVKRLSDISTIERAITEYVNDNKSYPDLSGVLRISTVIASGGSSLENARSGWIDGNLSRYTSKTPTDPINDSTYHYSYIHNDSTYEINAVLEHNPELMTNDGGNDPNSYEVGNNLLLITP